MNIKRISPELFPRFRNHLIHFVRQHGDRRITKKAIQWLASLDSQQLFSEGNLILAMVEGRRLLGLLVVSDYGIQESFIVVHKLARQQRIGSQLVGEMLSCLDKFYSRVALDNVPSLKLCLTMGMVGFKLVRGPTGKPTLWLGVGNWQREDVEKE